MFTPVGFKLYIGRWLCIIQTDLRGIKTMCFGRLLIKIPLREGILVKLNLCWYQLSIYAPFTMFCYW